jgi:signal transduction histidine kinase/CheY-like chemotaxis protein
MVQRLFTIDIRGESDVVLARRKARALAAALKLDPQDQARIATAVSEIARNTFQYAGGGRAEFALEKSPEPLLLITFKDESRGISNLEQILAAKDASQPGMSVGIFGAKRMMDYFHMESRPGEGSTVVLGKKVPLRLARVTGQELSAMLASVERVSDNPYEELTQQNKELLGALQELRARQEELAQLNRELDETNRGVVALYAELNDKADVLQRASEIKSHFFSNMSHEFKTPLNSITALSQILLDRLDGELTTEQEKQVRFINRSALDLAELVNDLLDLAKLEAGRVTIRPGDFQVSSLFSALRGMLRPLVSQNSSVNLVIEEPPPDMPEMFSDEGKISQILRNFISNALKFTERGEIRVSAKVSHDNMVEFSVADTGIGISDEDQERIFEEWTQIEGKLQKAAKGSGLGLPLSRKFAQLLGGDVFVRSEIGKGSTFFAAIPMNFRGETDVVYVPETKKPELDAAKWPVLVVEDNNEALFIYDKYLKSTPFQIVPAKNLREARKALSEFRPAAVILDVLLQGEQSWELLQELKQSASTADIPVLVITVVENQRKALAMGADSFHSKPVERAWLIEQLSHMGPRHEPAEVLIIDDDEVSRYVLKTLLGQSDFRFVEAASGTAGLQRIAEQKPRVIILDLAMPEVSGFDVLNTLKAGADTADIPVIIYTSSMVDSEENERLREAVAVISKQTKSREVSLEHFAEAFHKAGVPMKLRQVKQRQHV